MNTAIDQHAIPATLMRGGTSKGLVIRRESLPPDQTTRDAVLLAVMGAPDPREIDGVGGGHPLTSKVAIVGPSIRDNVDVDYLFLQIWPDRAEVGSAQTCGNMLAAVGPFAIESGLVAPIDGVTSVRVHLENTGAEALVHVATPGGVVSYAGQTSIDGVPGHHAPVELEFLDIAGSTCGAILPTGHVRDSVAGVYVTCIDNGMPVVCISAADLGVTGHEAPVELEGRVDVLARIESIRLAAGHLMGLGDVTGASVPKVALLSAPTGGGAVHTRTLIPHRVHEAIGVLGAVSVATSCLLVGTVGQRLIGLAPLEPATPVDVAVEHPSGHFDVTVSCTGLDDQGGPIDIRATVRRTARALMRGDVLVPASLWGVS